jgi:hypothetical protein
MVEKISEIGKILQSLARQAYTLPQPALFVSIMRINKKFQKRNISSFVDKVYLLFHENYRKNKNKHALSIGLSKWQPTGPDPIHLVLI